MYWSFELSPTFYNRVYVSLMSNLENPYICETYSLTPNPIGAGNQRSHNLQVKPFFCINKKKGTEYAPYDIRLTH